jgi:hypothetical protein
MVMVAAPPTSALSPASPALGPALTAELQRALLSARAAPAALALGATELVVQVSESACGEPEAWESCLVDTSCDRGECVTVLRVGAVQQRFFASAVGGCECTADFYGGSYSGEFCDQPPVLTLVSEPPTLFTPGANVHVEWTSSALPDTPATLLFDHPALPPVVLGVAQAGAGVLDAEVPWFMPKSTAAATAKLLIGSEEVILEAAVASPCDALGCVQGSCNPDTATCSCSSGYSGTRCDTSVCDVCNPYGAQCLAANTATAAPCSCLAGFSGPTCHVESACASMDCGNGWGAKSAAGACSSCQCRNQYSGAACEQCSLCVAGNTLSHNDCTRCQCKPGFHREDCACRGVLVSLYLQPVAAVDWTTARGRALVELGVRSEVVIFTRLRWEDVYVAGLELIDGNARLNVTLTSGCAALNAVSTARLHEEDTGLKTVYAAAEKLRAAFLLPSSQLFQGQWLANTNTTRGMLAEDQLCSSADACPASAGTVYQPQASDEEVVDDGGGGGGGGLHPAALAIIIIVILGLVAAAAYYFGWPRLQRYLRERRGKDHSAVELTTVSDKSATQRSAVYVVSGPAKPVPVMPAPAQREKPTEVNFNTTRTANASEAAAAVSRERAQSMSVARAGRVVLAGSGAGGESPRVGAMEPNSPASFNLGSPRADMPQVQSYNNSPLHSPLTPRAVASPLAGMGVSNAPRMSLMPRGSLNLAQMPMAGASQPQTVAVTSPTADAPQRYSPQMAPADPAAAATGKPPASGREKRKLRTRVASSKPTSRDVSPAPAALAPATSQPAPLGTSLGPAAAAGKGTKPAGKKVKRVLKAPAKKTVVKPATEASTTLPVGWREMETPDGDVYYYNEFTQENRRTRPS